MGCYILKYCDSNDVIRINFNTEIDIPLMRKIILNSNTISGCFVVLINTVSCDGEATLTESDIVSIDLETEYVFSYKECIGSDYFYDLNGIYNGKALGKIVRFDDFRCYEYGVSELNDGDVGIEVPVYTDRFNTCIECIGCDQEDDIEEYCEKESNTCETADKLFNDYYADHLEMVYGIKGCCGDNKVSHELDFRISLLDDMYDCNPNIPEARVLPCCVKPYLPTCRCEECEDECECNCEASIDSHHKCHTYIFSITQEMLDNATNNEEARYNGNVYFSYFRCRDSKVTIEPFNSVLNGEKRCVLGIPLLGYFNEDKFVDIKVLENMELNNLRCLECEEEVRLDCVDPCNKCR
jgi:hypothetical protein